MVLLFRLWTALAVLAALARCATAQQEQEDEECAHGQTAADIAASSGINLEGKVALVTGGRSGLGYAIADALLHQNATVVIASREEALNEQAVQNLKLNKTSANVSFMTFDLESLDSVRSFASDFLDTYDRLDYYFGNAGQGASGAQPLTVDGYERIFQVNYVGQVLLLEMLLPLLRESQPSRVVLTASSTHSLACGSVNLSPTTANDSTIEDSCWSDSGTLDILPFDQRGLDAINSTFSCLLNGTYPMTKFLMTQMAREVSKREANMGNDVSAWAWAPGNINTDLNRWATCCVGPVDSMAPCRYQLPYVGPLDAITGDPSPPQNSVPNFWTSPEHGAMAAIHVALRANTLEHAGKFFATYWQCKPELGYFAQGITPEIRAELYDRSKVWANISSISSATSNETHTTSAPMSPASSGAARMTKVACLAATSMSIFFVAMCSFVSCYC